MRRFRTIKNRNRLAVKENYSRNPDMAPGKDIITDGALFYLLSLILRIELIDSGMIELLDAGGLEFVFFVLHSC